MTVKISAKSGIAALAVVGIATVTACSSGSSSSSPAASTSASSASSSAGANPLGGGTSSGTVIGGAANFPENEVLAEVYALALQKAGVKVTTKLNIGAREVYYPQVEKGAITIIPEYHGSLLTVEAYNAPTAKSTADVDAALAAKLPSSLTVLTPAPGQYSDSIAVT